MMTKTELEWGRQQCLYRAAPLHVIYNPNSGLHEMVLPWKAAADHGTNVQMVRDAVIREIRKYRIPPIDLARAKSLPLDIRTLDSEDATIDTTLYPTAFFCNVCGRLLSEDPGSSPDEVIAAAGKLARKVPDGARCPTQGCSGNLVQWNLLTVHECGEIVHLPSFWRARCPTHGFDYLYFDRHNSERSSDWEIVCRGANCTVRRGRELFFFRHTDCELHNSLPDADPSFSTSPIQKATNFIPKVIPIVNSDQADRAPAPGTPAAQAVALGALRAQGYFHHFSPGDGVMGWRQQFRGSADAQDLSRARALELAARITDSQLREEMLRELKGPPAASGIPDDPRFAMLVEDPEYLREATDLAIYLDETRGNGIGDLLADPTLPDETAQSLTQGQGLQSRLGIATLRHIDDIALTSCLVGFTRGDYDPGKVMLRLYWSRKPGKSVPARVYTNTTRTEGILVQLNPSKTLTWLGRVNHEEVRTSQDFTKDLYELQKRMIPDSLRPFEPPTVPWVFRHYGMLHTVSHLLVKSVARFCGSEQEALSEIIYPYQNAVLCYANQSVDFSLEGLALAFEHHLPEILTGMVEDSERCPYNPECETKTGACHGCIHIAEFSCAFFNRALDRRWVTPASGGFLTVA